MLGLVNKRNLVPVRVWKTVRRKKEDSSTSIPLGATVGSGTVYRWVVVEEPGGSGMRGVRDLVMACTPWKVPARTSRSLVLTDFNPSAKVLWKMSEPAFEMMRRAKTGLWFVGL